MEYNYLWKYKLRKFSGQAKNCSSNESLFGNGINEQNISNSRMEGNRNNFKTRELRWTKISEINLCKIFVHQRLWVLKPFIRDFAHLVVFFCIVSVLVLWIRYIYSKFFSPSRKKFQLHFCCVFISLHLQREWVFLLKLIGNSYFASLLMQNNAQILDRLIAGCTYNMYSWFCYALCTYVCSVSASFALCRSLSSRWNYEFKIFSVYNVIIFSALC